MAAQVRTHSSPYAEHVLTKDHPASAQFRNVEPPDYAKASILGPWLASRWEEFVVTAFLVLVFVYCFGIYAGIWVVSAPVRSAFSYSWDVLLASFVLLKLYGLTLQRPPSRKDIAAMKDEDKEKALRTKKAFARKSANRRNAALALSAAVALVRWQFGSVSALLQR